MIRRWEEGRLAQKYCDAKGMELQESSDVIRDRRAPGS